MMEFLIGALLASSILCIAAGIYLETHKPKPCRGVRSWHDVPKK